MKINILGTEYDLILTEELEGIDGYCDFSIKKIKICKTLLKESKGYPEVENKPAYFFKVLRHEIIHAMHMESGHDALSVLDNEAIVDWMAHMHHKLQQILLDFDVKFKTIL